MTDRRVREAAEYLRRLAGSGRDCDHPPRFRAAPTPRSFDPSEWRCLVCGTEQVRRS